VLTAKPPNPLLLLLYAPGSVSHRLGPLLREFLDTYLPNDAHERCSGTTHVAVTRLLPYWRTQMVSHFESRDDLISALMTSCHIPWWVEALVCEAREGGGGHKRLWQRCSRAVNIDAEILRTGVV
jgi:hypothetical protein